MSTTTGCGGIIILTVEMAYQNARLLAKPDNPWLASGLKK
ncbi:MAG: DUF3825 domain-containing protein [Firmicutes bacterium]|nr:DUF3825 domain-containing protein [Bacillota bacterium]